MTKQKTKEDKLEDIFLKKKLVKNVENGVVKKRKPVGSQKKTLRKIWLFLILLISILIVGGGLVFFHYKKVSITIDVRNRKMDEQQLIIRTISQYMELPEDEEPTLATVMDAGKVNGQEFFAKAQNGDKVLLFVKNQKAILYRPETEKIIEVSTIANLSGDENNAAAEDSQNQKKSENPAQVGITKKIKVAVYNGTRQKGLAKTLAEKISGLEGVGEISVGNAIKDYTKNMVIDLSGENTELANEIAKNIFGEVGEMPAGEKKPEVDILIIGGAK